MGSWSEGRAALDPKVEGNAKEAAAAAAAAKETLESFKAKLRQIKLANIKLAKTVHSDEEGEKDVPLAQITCSPNEIKDVKQSVKNAGLCWHHGIAMAATYRDVLHLKTKCNESDVERLRKPLSL